MGRESVQEYILSKCKQLCPYFDPKETIHAFCGARAKSSRGDWIIEPSAQDGNFIHVAGIDSPGLAGSPAIALEVVRLLREAGLDTPPNETFNPNRALGRTIAKARMPTRKRWHPTSFASARR